MSYDIYLYPKPVKDAWLAGLQLDEIEHPVIDEQVRQRFRERLERYDFEFAGEFDSCIEYNHKDKSIPIQVSIFPTEIAFSVAYSPDAPDAVFDALQTASELADSDDLFVFDPQAGEWNE